MFNFEIILLSRLIFEKLLLNKLKLMETLYTKHIENQSKND